MTETLSNFATSTLNTTVNASILTVIVDDGTTFPATGNFRLRIDDELMLCSARTAGTITVTTRGIEGTSGVGHTAGASVYGVLTRSGLETFIEQEARDAVVGGQATGTVGAITVANTHGTSGTTAHHPQSHAETDHTSAIRVSDEGSDQGAVRVIDFVGSGVSAAVAATTATVTISGGGGGGGSPPFQPAYVVASNDAPASVKTIADATASSTAAQTAINTAITAATGATSTTIATAFGTNPRGSVVLTAGRFTQTGPILMKRGVHLIGQGPWTFLIPTATASGFTDAGSGTGGALIKMATVNEQLVSVSNLYMYGNYTTGNTAGCSHAIYFDLNNGSFTNVPVTSPDPVITVADIVILGFDNAGTRHGVWCNQGNAWASFYTRIRGKDILTNGFYMASAADSHVSDCQFSAGTGFYFNGGNCHVSNSKSWFCGTYGFRWSSGRCLGSNLQSQDDVSGYFVDGSPTTLSNIEADTFQTTGLMVSSNQARVSNFVCFNRGNGAFATSAVGLDVDAAYHDVFLQGAVDSSNVTTPIGVNVATRIPATTGNWARVNVVSSSAHTVASTGLSIGV